MSHSRIAQCDAFFAALRHKPVVMGILNLTPDSFSDGGKFNHLEDALARAKQMAAEGAGIIDIGAESTRPGHMPLSSAQEWERLAEILPQLASWLTVPLSIDTYKAETAAKALACGIAIINDIWGLQHDPDMARVVAEHQAGIIIMHNRTTIEPELDLLGDMKRFFDRSLALAEQKGIDHARIMLDPGVGFGKTIAQNWAAIRAIADLKQHYDLPVLIALSRKRMFGQLLGLEVHERLIPTLAANMEALHLGASVFRVHDVKPHHEAFAVAGAIGNG